LKIDDHNLCTGASQLLLRLASLSRDKFAKNSP
jgi:hypothetical protein